MTFVLITLAVNMVYMIKFEDCIKLMLLLPKFIERNNWIRYLNYKA